MEEETHTVHTTKDQPITSFSNKKITLVHSPQPPESVKTWETKIRPASVSGDVTSDPNY